MDEETLTQLIDRTVDKVETVCSPDEMSKEEAVEFLELVIGRLQSSIEALREEMEG